MFKLLENKSTGDTNPPFDGSSNLYAVVGTFDCCRQTTIIEKKMASPQ
jgi:hypothetical protein